MSTGNRGPGNSPYPLGQEPEWGGDGSEPPFDDSDLDVAAPEAIAPPDADEIVQKNAGFSQLPIGEWEIVITGYQGSGEDKYIKCNVDGKQIGYTTKKRTLRIALADNPNASGFFDIYEPPVDRDGQVGYWHGVPEGAKAKGWHANIYRLLVDRLFRAEGGWPVGKPCPAPARFPRNWIGRHVIATVEKGDDWTDDKGKPREGKNKIRPFSFQPVAGNQSGQANRTNGPGPTSSPGMPPSARPGQSTQGRVAPPVQSKPGNVAFDM